ncbi:LacI family DNA-binding transcriptional regulator [Echinimonas agarilytica]|uniref:LacI family transcriptional regulator n=1 Tax=Echinimonas agarilytica TaxID=1215918 RepID=A0AA41W4Z9_9GAMM|nr:LacI family DNA-binding transcriptional regulator [Echinimonas agarilytica]MCM2678572.1 LacI family transcriptional regulator [Echinimonas agarilytica]
MRAILRQATLDDIASVAGVSRVTVSRVLNESPDVKEITRQKVQMAIDALSQQPFTKPSSDEFKPRRNLLVLLYSSTQSHTSLSFIQSAMQTARKQGFELHIEDVSFWSCQDASSITHWCIEQRARGVVLLPPFSESEEAMQHLAQYGISVVHVEPKEASEYCPHVSVDHHQAGYSLTKRLLNQGMRHIEFIESSPMNAKNRLFYLGHLDAVRQQPISALSRHLPSAEFLNANGDYQRAECLLSGDSWPDALICQTYGQVLAAIHTADKFNIVIPEQLKVIYLSEELELPIQDDRIIQVCSPFRSLAAGAVDLLVKRVRHKLNRHDYAQSFEPQILTPQQELLQ